MVRIAEEFVIKITDNMAGIAQSSASTPSAGSGASGGIINMGAKLGVGIGIGMELVNLLQEAITGVFKPVLGMLKALSKMIAELLRPLVSVVMNSLSPLLIMVKPLIDMFRGFMAPFMSIAKEYQNIARQQMISGDISGAMGTSMEAVKTIMGPFIVAAFSVLTQLATTLLVTNVTNLINSIIGIMGAVMQHIPVIGDDIKNALDIVQDNVNSGANATIEKINGTVLTLTEDILSGMLTNAEDKLAEFKDSYPANYSQAFIETPAGALEEMASQAKASSTNMEKVVTDGLNSMDTEIVTKFDKDKGTVQTTFRTGLDTMLSSVRVFTAKVSAYADQINSISFSRRRDDDETKVGVQVGGTFAGIVVD